MIAASLGLVLAATAGFVGRGVTAQEPTLTLHFLDVGQGDAVVIRSPEGKTALVDAGPSYIVHHLHALGIDSIDLAVASHGHLDHIGGMLGVVQSMPVTFYMDNGLGHTTATYLRLMETLVDLRINYLEATRRTLSMGSVTIRVLPPPEWAREQNVASVGLLIEYGSFKALLTGDSEIEELNHFLDMGLPQVTVLKAAHHGARNGVTPRWLSVTKPKVVVISVGANNSFGHPDPWALRYYRVAAEQIYRTDQHGTVTIVGRRDGSYQVGVGRGVEGAGPSVAARGPAAAPTDSANPAAPTLYVNPDPPGNDNHNLNAEFAVIRNDGNAALSIARWTLCDAALHCFTFPEGTAIASGDSVYVRTGTGTSSIIDFYFNRRQAIWNNRGDVATLYDESGQVVATYEY